jgi:adenine/guanine phosphoribosyltransferase-like PRPP-binding protein
MARPTKFTQERAKRIVDAIRGGIDAVVAAEAGGISQSTFIRVA